MHREMLKRWRMTVANLAGLAAGLPSCTQNPDRAFAGVVLGRLLQSCCCVLQGFYTAVDRETLKCWRMTAANLAELAAGPQLPSPRYTKWKRPSVEELRAAERLSETAAEHIATSNAPVVNTLWKVRSSALPDGGSMVLCMRLYALCRPSCIPSCKLCKAPRRGILSAAIILCPL